jgi:hypothetical protein
MYMEKVVSFRSGKYVYNVTYKPQGGLPAYIPVKKDLLKLRSDTRMYFDKRDDTYKEIVYPEELWFTNVLPNDPVEEYIHTAIEMIPNWTRIEITNRQ